MASMRKGKSFNETTCVQRKPQYIRTLSAILVSLCTLNIIQTKKPEKKTILHSTWEYSLYLLFYLKRTSNWISLKWLRGCRWVTFSLSFATPHRFPTLKFIPLNIILKKATFLGRSASMWSDYYGSYHPGPNVQKVDRFLPQSLLLCIFTLMLNSDTQIQTLWYVTLVSILIGFHCVDFPILIQWTVTLLSSGQCYPTFELQGPGQEAFTPT